MSLTKPRCPASMTGADNENKLVDRRGDEEEPVDAPPPTEYQHPDTNRTHFPFQSLPPELRNKIYRHVLVFPYAIMPVQSSNTLSGRWQHRAKHLRKATGLHYVQIPYPYPPAPSLSLLAVSHAVYAEALPFFYRENYFDFQDTNILSQFLASISPARRAWLGELTIQVRGHMQHSKKTFEILEKDAVRLRALHVKVPYRWLKDKNLPDTTVWPWTDHYAKSARRRPNRDMQWAHVMRRIRGLTEVTLFQDWTGEAEEAEELAAAESWFRSEMLKPKLDPVLAVTGPKPARKRTSRTTTGDSSSAARPWRKPKAKDRDPTYEDDEEDTDDDSEDI